MKYCKKYISVFLLLVFTWVILPPSFVHECFANHQDTECLPDHDHESAHVESLHKHCDIFKTNTPLYDIPQLTVFEKPVRKLVAEVYTGSRPVYFSTAHCAYGSRGPPLS